MTSTRKAEILGFLLSLFLAGINHGQAQSARESSKGSQKDSWTNTQSDSPKIDGAVSTPALLAGRNVPGIKIADAEVEQAQQWLGPQMTADEIAKFREWQDRIRHKYGVQGQFWLDTNRGEIRPVLPAKELPWHCKELASCR